MNRFVLAQAATRDIRSIQRYLQGRASEEVVRRILEDISSEVAKIAEEPSRGRYRVDVPNPRYRFSRVHSYVIAYRFDGTVVTIARVIHGARDIGRLIR